MLYVESRAVLELEQVYRVLVHLFPVYSLNENSPKFYFGKKYSRQTCSYPKQCSKTLLLQPTDLNLSVYALKHQLNRKVFINQFCLHSSSA